jgi:hypothetical protein
MGGERSSPGNLVPVGEETRVTSLARDHRRSSWEEGLEKSGGSMGGVPRGLDIESNWASEAAEEIESVESEV